MAISNVTQDTLQNSWKVWARAYAQSNGAYRPRFISQFVPFLVSQRNRNAMSGQVVSVGRNLLQQAVNSNDKGLYSAVVKWRKYAAIDLVGPDTSTGYCGLSGEGVEYDIQAFALNKRTVAMAKFDGNINQCSEETRQQAQNDVFQSLLEKALTTFALQVEKEAFAKTGASTYRHIGALPTIDGTPRPAGEDLPLFRASNASEMNFLGDRKLDRDRALGGLQDYAYFGDFMAKAYAKARDISRPTNDAGYDFSMLQELQTARFLFSDQMHTNTGLQHPLLVLEPGVMQLVTFAEFAQAPESISGFSKTSIIDPVFGLTWNLIEKIEPCDDGRRFSTNYILEIDWALISAPTCSVGDLRRDGTNGAYLYNIVCSDDTICDLTPVKGLYETNPSAINACADQDATVCNGGCNVALSAGISGDDYIVTANAVPSLGATISTYAWLVDGAPAGGNTPSLTLDNLITTGGTVITVTVTDSLGCVATNEIVVDKECPNSLYLLTVGGAPTGGWSNGDTYAAGTIAAGAAIVFTVGNDVSSEVALNVFTASITGDAATQSIPAVPAVLAAGDNFAMTATAEATTGNYSVTFNVTSDDCDHPAFELTVTYSIA